MAEPIKTINLSNNPTSVVLGDLLAAVQNTSTANALENVDITFTCKVCKAKKTSLKELIEHVSSNICTITKSETPVRKRGRPPKSKNKTVHETEDYTPTIINSTESLQRDDKTSERCTRIKSGALKRKSALQLLGLAEQDHGSDVDDEDIEDATKQVPTEGLSAGEPPVKRGRGRPRKHFYETSVSKSSNVDFSDHTERKACDKGSNIEVAKTGSPTDAASEQDDIQATEGKYDKDKTLVIKLTHAAKSDAGHSDDEDDNDDDIDDDNDDEVLSTTGDDNMLQQAMDAVANDLAEGRSTASDNEPEGEDDNKGQMVTILCPKSLKRKRLPVVKQFPCDLCHMRKFPNQDELDVHLKAHCNPDRDAPDRFKCMECGFIQNSWNRLLTHLLTHDQYRKVFKNSSTVLNIYGEFPCPKCTKTFSRKTALITHMRNVHRKADHTCEVCGKNFPQMDDKVFERHVDKCRNISMKCSQCDYTTTVGYNLKLHMRIHKGKGYVCETCNAVFPTRQRYDVHCLTHSKVRPKYICEVCSQEFVSHDAVKKHAARFHSGITERTWKCDQCSYVGKLEYDLKKHVNSVHMKRFKCEQCAFSTNVESQMTDHMQYHSPEHIHPCLYPSCYFRATSPKLLANHVSTKHNLQFKNQCPVCLKRFKKKTVLLRHLIIHTNDKPYSCQECGMNFYSHTSYYRHRNKTGHDNKREGVVSIPQNITIQYLEDIAPEDSLPPGVESGAVISDVDSVLKLAAHEASRAQKLQSAGLVQVHASGPLLAESDPSMGAPATQPPQSIMLEGSTPGAVLKAETIGDSIVVQHSHRQEPEQEQTIITEDTTATDNLVEVPMVISQDGMSYVTQLNGTEIMIHEGADTDQQYIIETGEGVVDEDLDQVTYVLQVEGDGSEPTQLPEGITFTDGLQILHNLKATEETGVNGATHEAVVGEEEIPAALEVKQDSDGQQYSVMMVQDTSQAGVSMVQLNDSHANIQVQQ